MSFVKRAFQSLGHYWLKNLLVIIMFTVLFTCCVGFLVVYATSSKQLEEVRASTACAVTLKAPTYILRGINDSAHGEITLADVEKFVDDPSVVGHNYGETLFVDFVDSKPLYAEEAKAHLKERLRVYDAPVYMMVDSARHKAFTGYGYNLIAGRHFAADESDPRVCLVSKEFAELNKLQVGSQFSVRYNVFLGSKDGFPDVPLKVIGIFKAKESVYLKGMNAREEEIILRLSD